MTEGNNEANKKSTIVESKKKTYQPPSWEVEQVFEKLALSCGSGDILENSAVPLAY